RGRQTGAEARAAPTLARPSPRRVAPAQATHLLAALGDRAMDCHGRGTRAGGAGMARRSGPERRARQAPGQPRVSATNERRPMGALPPRPTTASILALDRPPQGCSERAPSMIARPAQLEP